MKSSTLQTFRNWCISDGGLKESSFDAYMWGIRQFESRYGDIETHQLLTYVDTESVLESVETDLLSGALSDTKINPHEFKECVRPAVRKLHAFLKATEGALETHNNTLNELNEDSQKLLRLLVSAIESGKIQAGIPKTYLSYKDSLIAMGSTERLHNNRPLYMRFRNRTLEPLVRWVQKHSLPAITGLIVNGSSHKPGDGYFTVYSKKPSDLEWWHSEISKCFDHDWSALLDEKLTFSNIDIKSLIKINEGKEYECTQKQRARSRVLRDAAIRHFSQNKELKCTVCEWQKPTFPLRGSIIEIHHQVEIHTLPKSGHRITIEDALKYLTPVCPTCHRLLHARPGKGAYEIDELKRMIRGSSVII